MMNNDINMGMNLPIKKFLTVLALISRKKMKTSYRKKLQRFCQFSTVHGMHYVYRSKYYFDKISWLLIIMCSCSLCVCLCWMILQQYVNDPTVTVVESTHYSVSNIPFPSVVLCDIDDIYGPGSKPITDILLNRGYNTSTIELFLKSMSDPTMTDETNPMLKKLYSLLYDVDLSYPKLLEMVAKPCDVLLRKCVWRSESYNCSLMFRKTISIVGFCCIFDIEYFKANTKSSINYDASLTERTRSLELVIDAGNTYPNGSRVVYGDVQFSVVDPQNSLTWTDMYTQLSANSFYDVSVNVLEITASDEVKALSKNLRKCILDSDIDLGSSFYFGCVTNLLLTKVVEHCKCLPFYFWSKSLAIYPNCTWDKYKCISRSKDAFQGSSVEMDAFNKCYQKCDYIQYDAQVEHIKRTRKSKHFYAIKDKLTDQESLAVVTVRFGDRTCMKYRREVLYTWDQMLANLGGIFGLCMGGSIISIIEIIWFTFESIIHFINNKRIERKSRIESKIQTREGSAVNEEIPRNLFPYVH